MGQWIRRLSFERLSFERYLALPPVQEACAAGVLGLLGSWAVGEALLLLAGL